MKNFKLLLISILLCTLSAFTIIFLSNSERDELLENANEITSSHITTLNQKSDLIVRKSKSNVEIHSALSKSNPIILSLKEYEELQNNNLHIFFSSLDNELIILKTEQIIEIVSKKSNINRTQESNSYNFNNSEKNYIYLVKYEDHNKEIKKFSFNLSYVEYEVGDKLTFRVNN